MIISPNPIDQKYLEHRVFKLLSEYADFYSSLAFTVMPFVPGGVEGVMNIDTYMFSSMQGTLESIKSLLTQGRINDAYALLRKYHDSAIINVYTNLYLKDHHSIDNFVVQHINDWVKGNKRGNVSHLVQVHSQGGQCGHVQPKTNSQ